MMKLNKSIIKGLILVFIGFFGAQSTVLAGGNACFSYITATPKTLPPSNPVYLSTLVEYTINNTSGIDWRIVNQSNLPPGTTIKTGTASDGSTYCGSSVLLNPSGQSGSSCVFGFTIPPQSSLASITGQVKLHVAKTPYTITPDPFTIQLTCPSQAPTITSLNPIADSSFGGDKVTITGTGFITGFNSVMFGDKPATIDPTQPQTATSIRIISPPSVTPTIKSTVNVKVTIPCSLTSAISEKSKFTYELRPAITKVNPDVVPMNGNIAVTIDGINFDENNTKVTFGIYGDGIISGKITSTSITVTPPAALAGTTGLVTVPVTVTTPGGASAVYNVTYASPPTISSLNPIQGPLKGDIPITITGNNFVTSAASLTSPTTISFGGKVIQIAATPTPTSSSMIVNLPSILTMGGVTVTAATLGVASIPASSAIFTYDPVPTIATVSPNSGPAVGGMVVTITGTGFIPGYTNVTFGSSTPIVNVPVTNNGTTITVTSPAGTAGAVPITVTTPGGPVTLASAFTYIDWVKINSGLGLGQNSISLCSDNLGNMYAAVEMVGIYKLSVGDTQWQQLSFPDNGDVSKVGSDGANVYAMVDYNNSYYRPSVYVSTDRGGSWSDTGMPNTGTNKFPLYFYSKGDGAAYISYMTSNTAGKTYQKTAIQNWPAIDNTDYVTSICSDTAGNLYVGLESQGGDLGSITEFRMRSSVGVWSSIYNIDTNPQHQNSLWLYSSYSDNNGNVYVGTPIGIYKGSNTVQNWSLIAFGAGSPMRLCVDDKGNAYAGSGYYNGVYVSSDNWVSSLYLGNPGPGSVQDIVVGKDGYLYVVIGAYDFISRHNVYDVYRYNLNG